MVFEIPCPHNGKEYTLVLEKIPHSDGIIMYFGRFKHDRTALFNCIKIDNQQPFITLSENVAPPLQKALLESVSSFERITHAETVAVTAAL